MEMHDDNDRAFHTMKSVIKGSAQNRTSTGTVSAKYSKIHTSRSTVERSNERRKTCKMFLNFIEIPDLFISHFSDLSQIIFGP